MSAPSMLPVTRLLATFTCEANWSSIPATTQQAGRRLLLNAVGLAVEAAYHPAVEAALDAIGPLDTRPQASLLGRAQKMGVLATALVTGIAIHAEDFDDTHLSTVMHPGAVLPATAVPLGEWLGASGEEVLTAVVVGSEVAIRVAEGMCPSHYDLGWHVTSTAGHVGAAAAAARLLRLDAKRTTAALSLAAVQAGGLTSALGTMTKAFHPGKAAADGVEAALLAQSGWPAPPDAIESPDGLAVAASSEPDPATMIEGLADRWELDANAIKPYACGVVSHPVIDAGILLRERVRADDVAAVDLFVNPVVVEVMGVDDPTDGLQSKFSVYHCFAVGLLDGAGGPPQFSDGRARAYDVASVRRVITVHTDPAVRKGAARATARTVDGQEHTVEVPFATASAQRPMTDEQLREKIRRLVAPRLTDAGAQRLIDVTLDLERVADVRPLIAASRRPEED